MTKDPNQGMSVAARLYDMNAHLDFLSDRDFAALLRSEPKFERQYAMSGVSPKGFHRQFSLAEQHRDKIKLGLGLHPWFVCEQLSRGESPDSVVESFLKVLSKQEAQIDFIGEIGLDFSSDERRAHKAAQIHVLKRVLEFNRKQRKPLLFHVVSAHGDATSIIEEFTGELSFVIHGFSASIEVARGYIKLGGLLSIGSGVLHRSFKKLRDCLGQRDVLSHLVFETDQPKSPDDPETYRPELMHYIIDETAKVSGVAGETLIERAEAHFLEFFSRKGDGGRGV